MREESAESAETRYRYGLFSPIKQPNGKGNFASKWEMFRLIDLSLYSLACHQSDLESVRAILWSSGS